MMRKLIKRKKELSLSFWIWRQEIKRSIMRFLFP